MVDAAVEAFGTLECAANAAGVSPFHGDDA